MRRGEGRERGITRVLCVTKKKLWVVAGVVAAGSLAAVPPLTAPASPRGRELSASIKSTATPGTYSLTLTNGHPNCGYEIQSRGAFVAKGTFTTTADTPVLVTTGSKPGTYAFNIRTTGCSPVETAT